MNNSETDLIFILSGDIHTGPQAEDTTEPHFGGGGGYVATVMWQETHSGWAPVRKTSQSIRQDYSKYHSCCLSER